MKTRHLVIIALAAVTCAALSCQTPTAWRPPPKPEEKPLFSQIGQHVLPRKRLVELTCEISVTGIPEKAKKVQVWIPYPAASAWQGPIEPVIESPASFRPVVCYDASYNQPSLLISAEAMGDGIPKDLNASYTLQVQRSHLAMPEDLVTSIESDNAAAPDLSADLKLWAGAGLDNLTDALAAIGAADNSPAGRARAVFDYVIATLDPDNSAALSPLKDVLASRRGNSLDYATLACALMRAVGIPARIETGVYLPEDKTPDRTEITGRAAWVLFHAKGCGWTACDPYLADRFPELKDYLFGGLCANRVQLATGPQPGLTPAPAAGSPVLFSDTIAEADGKPVAATMRIYFRDVCPK